MLSNPFNLAGSAVLLPAVGFVAFVFLLYFLLSDDGLYPAIDVVGVDDKQFFKLNKARKEFLRNGRAIIAQGLRQCRGAFQVVTPYGPQIILPNRFADEIRNDPDLSSAEATVDSFYGHLPGFDPFYQATDYIMRDLVQKKLTQSLNIITEDLADEAGLALKDRLGELADWEEITLKPNMLYFAARISSRVFSGLELCRNEEWLALTPQYVIDAFMAARRLRNWPKSLTRVVHWFLPETRRLRAQVRRARELVSPIVEKRRRDPARAAKAFDAIAWTDEIANGRPIDNAVFQLGLALAAIHTTTEQVTHIMFELLDHPEYIDRLRDEIIQTVGVGGWKKSSLYNLKLMDSVLKETLRVHVSDVATMSRIAQRPVPLSDGTVIPKGARVMVSVDKMHDPQIYPDAHKWVGDRFYNMRQQPGGETKSQFVTTSPDHLGFGHGMHSCPGRFFATNEIKVALCFLLMNYDWKFTGNGKPQDLVFGTEVVANPGGRVLVKRRHSHICAM